jgi:hypothetical protein
MKEEHHESIDEVAMVVQYMIYWAGIPGSAKNALLSDCWQRLSPMFRVQNRIRCYFLPSKPGVAPLEQPLRMICLNALQAILNVGRVRMQKAKFKNDFTHGLKGKMGADSNIPIPQKVPIT